MTSSFGRAFRLTTFGESHGKAVGVIVDGCPPGLALDVEHIQHDLDRRRPGQSRLVTQRKEGRWIYYALPGRDAPVAVREALDWVIKTLGRSAEALADRKRLAAIRRCDPSELCRQQLRA